MNINDMIAWLETRGFKVAVACTKAGHMFKISKYDYYVDSIYTDGFGGEIAQQQFLDRLLNTWNQEYRRKQEQYEKGEQSMANMFTDKTKDALIAMFRGYARKYKLGICYNYDRTDILEMKFYMSRSYKPTKIILIKLDKLKNIFDTFTVVVRELDVWRNEIEPLFINWPDRETVEYIKADVENTAKLYTAMLEIQDRNNRRKLPAIKNVHFSNDGKVTVVIWADGTKTIVRCNNEKPDPEKGLAMAIAKKALGTNKSGSNYYDIFKKWLPKPEEEQDG